MPRGYHIPFTQDQEQYIKDQYLKIPVKRLASHVGATGPRIMRFLDKHGLEIPPEIIEQRKQIGRRKKGDVPYNKGLKQTDYMSAAAIEKTKATRFKKGNLPHNTNKQGDGAIVVRVDSQGHPYKHIRLSLGVWVHYHRYLWEQENGEVPEGHVVVFKDGNTLNTDIDNLKLISKTENMLRNSIWKFPADVVTSLTLVNELENKLKKLTQNGKKQII